MKTWKLMTAGLLGGVALWFALSGPVLLRCSLGPFLRDKLVILNPFRNRVPERLAITIVAQIHSSNCMQELGATPSLESKRAVICEKQTKDPLRRVCALMDRVDFQNQVGISFDCGYEDRAPSGAFVTLTFLQHEGDFVLQDYERIY